MYKSTTAIEREKMQTAATPEMGRLLGDIKEFEQLMRAAARVLSPESRGPKLMSVVAQNICTALNRGIKLSDPMHHYIVADASKPCRRCGLVEDMTLTYVHCFCPGDTFETWSARQIESTLTRVKRP